MPIHRQLAAAVIAVSISAAAAQAQELGLVADLLFDRIDANRDGVINKAEVQAFRAQMFDRQDANHDGFVTLVEIEQEQLRNQQRRVTRLARLSELRSQMPTPSERVSGMDQNKDGKISREEFVNGANDWFDIFSVNSAGLSKAQFAAFLDGKR